MFSGVLARHQLGRDYIQGRERCLLFAPRSNASFGSDQRSLHADIKKDNRTTDTVTDLSACDQRVKTRRSRTSTSNSTTGSGATDSTGGSRSAEFIRDDWSIAGACTRAGNFQRGGRLCGDTADTAGISMQLFGAR